ncbi:hypothetical protein NPIL_618671 [Nephila pilipes]|uniref:Uncharacterized protein n=1 Tax=Nephila pilipes TaxID=299642 RepID=A0A8X6NVT5_NEPPI|nr:hypothetical protein NPIL_618671 [Nephila pilipes]
MFCDKTEEKLELNADLKLNTGCSSSNSHKKELRVDVSPCTKITTVNKPFQTDCFLIAPNRTLKQSEYESVPSFSMDASDLTPKSSGTQSRNKHNNPGSDNFGTLERVQKDDLPFEKRRRHCRTKYTRNLESIPQEYPLSACFCSSSSLIEK